MDKISENIFNYAFDTDYNEKVICTLNFFIL